LKSDVFYGGYTFDWHGSNLSPSYATGGVAPVIKEKIEPGQTFSYTYPETVKDPNLHLNRKKENAIIRKIYLYFAPGRVAEGKEN
jgi:hypothetical protein